MAAACRHASEHGKTHLVGWVNATNRPIIDLFTSLFDELEINKFRYSIFSRVLLGVPRWVLISLNVNAPLVRGISGRANSDQPVVEANL